MALKHQEPRLATWLLALTGALGPNLDRRNCDPR
jgi:hypothetical protein